MIRVNKAGMFSTIQDQGRWGYQAYGMPVAGAMDRYASRVANLLAGNASDAAVLEMTLLGGSFCFTEETRAAICGAEMKATLNGKRVENWSSFQIPAGGELEFSFAENGCRAYLALQGGFDVPVVLGSRSTYSRGGIGGFSGRALKSGDALSVIPTSNEAWRPYRLPQRYAPGQSCEIKVRVLLGPQEELFTPDGIETFLTQSYVISNEADRMGYRFEGAKIEHCAKADIISDALCLGAVQVPGHGMPIVMMADRQTTGGYAKIATVIGPDLRLLAQAKPGDAVRFVACSDAEAVASLEREEEAYLEIVKLLNSAPQKNAVVRRFNVFLAGQSYDVEIEEVAK